MTIEDRRFAVLHDHASTRAPLPAFDGRDGAVYVVISTWKCLATGDTGEDVFVYDDQEAAVDHYLDLWNGRDEGHWLDLRIVETSIRESYDEVV
jgi:hypothetical protein